MNGATVDITPIIVPAITGVVSITATFVGLVVWLVKNAEKRQAEITDRYFRFLESQQQAAASTTAQLVSANQAHADANNRLASIVDQHTADLKTIAAGMRSVLDFQSGAHAKGS